LHYESFNFKSEVDQEAAIEVEFRFMPKGRLLLVEDDNVIIEVLKELLEAEDYEVNCARNGADALNFLQSVPELPGLILLDLKMPVMNGFEFRVAQEQDGRIAGIPIVIMTAAEQIESKKMAIGAKNFIKKPFDFNVVLKAVQRYYVG
jgi:CheY-like chemotaxis protein